MELAGEHGVEFMRKVVKCLAGIISAVLLLWFSIPLFRNGILNIGNATGIVVFLVILMCILFSKKLVEFVQWLCRRKGGRVLIGAAALVIAAGVLTVGIETILMVHAANRKPEESVTVVVLGCRVYGENPSLMLAERLEAAYAYLSEHEDAACVLSGGKGGGENISEAEAMYRWLIDRGIDKERLFLEDKSTSTRENLSFSLEIIEESQLPEKIGIATNEFHEYRAGKIAGALGLEYYSISGKTAWWLLPTYYVRELYGILYEWFL